MGSIDIVQPLNRSSAATEWADDLPEDPGNTVYVERRVAQTGAKVATVAVMVPVVGASAAGTYLFDVLKNGVTVLTAPIDLEGLVAGTWSTGTVKADGSEDLLLGDTVRAQAVSDNTDLVGYFDGLLFTLSFGPQ